MGVIFRKEPQLENPELIAAWPGIGNIGLMAVDDLKGTVKAEYIAEIDPVDYFYPRSVSIRDSQLDDLEFPRSRFYYKRIDERDLLFFIGDEQPQDEEKILQIANTVLDVAQHFGCRRVYTSGAAVALIHHTTNPRVWVVPNSRQLIKQFKWHDNAILMSEIEGKGGQGNITGLNGLLLGVARQRGMDGICLLGEVPIYISQFPVPYPKASKVILEVLAMNLGMEADASRLDEMARGMDDNIQRFFERIPEEIRERIDQLKQVSHVEEQDHPGPITEEDKKTIMRDLEDFFRGGSDRIE
ncbi:MAG: PAC2 family protein [Chloroflexota bacterium]|nr:PAC2 family protein [Chloroflexota bacterium]